MEFKLYHCTHCGNVAYKVVDSGAKLVCCGETMEELDTKTANGAAEKHVPVIERSGDTVKVKVAEVQHPMEEKHYIPVIAAVSGDTAVIRSLKPGDEPVLETTCSGKIAAYEWCNLHGFYKTQE